MNDEIAEALAKWQEMKVGLLFRIFFTYPAE
jgi:hypothetical protein